MKYYKDAIKEILSSCIVMAVIIFVVFAATGEMEAAIYGVLFIGFVFLLVLGFAFLKSRGINPEEFTDSLKDVGDTLQDINDTMTYMNMSEKEKAMYNALKKNNDKKKE